MDDENWTLVDLVRALFAFIGMYAGLLLLKIARRLLPGRARAQIDFALEPFYRALFLEMNGEIRPAFEHREQELMYLRMLLGEPKSENAMKQWASSN